MNTLAAADDWECNAHAYLQLDQQLHERFVERGGTPKMLQIFQQMNVHMHVMRVAQGYAARDFEAMHFEHEQIFEALESRSSDRLNAVLLNHLESSRMRAYKMLMDRE
jgi:DNA-binding GntR family transcriptional regulator